MIQCTVHISMMLVAFVTQSGSSAGQPDKKVHRSDSVTVSAGFSKEQLALEDRLNAMIHEGDQQLQNGNGAAAIKSYESARDFMNKEPLLAEQKIHVTEKLARGYRDGGRPEAAVVLYSELLKSKKATCDAQSLALSDCADAQHNLGIAQIQLGDFSGALISLRNAETSYGKAEKFAQFHEISMAEIKDKAQVEVLIAVALFRLGKTAEAINTVETAIPQLKRVESDAGVDDGLRNSARSHLEDAQTVLAKLKSAQ